MHCRLPALLAVLVWGPFAGAADDVLLHLRFEPGAANEPVVIHAARRQETSPGPLTRPAEAANAGSLAFDGKTAIVTTKLAGNHSQLAADFTWEGFLLVPASHRCQTDGAIAHRFLSQFVDETGGSTRLAVGLSALKEGGPPLLCIAFSGTANRHNGRIPVIPDLWHHFAVVHETTETGGKLTWYLDYEPAGELALTGTSARTTLKPGGAAPLTIGARLLDGKSVDRGFTGSLDEIRITARALKPDEFLRVKVPVVERHIAAALYEDLPARFDWDFASIAPFEQVPHEALAFIGIPTKFSERGYEMPRRGRHALRAEREIALPAGEYRLLLRTTADARLTVDGRPLIDARTRVADNPLGELPRGPRDFVANFTADGKPHTFALAAVEVLTDEQTLGDVVVCYAPVGGDEWRLLGSTTETASLSPAAWAAYRGRTLRFFHTLDADRRQAAIARGNRRWDQRHAQARRQAAAWQPAEPDGDGNPIDRIIDQRLHEAGIEPAPRVDDTAFLRRISLDIRGRIPSADEVRTFLADRDPDKRTRVIDRWLASDEWADSWVGYWQDVLAENPSILKPTLNNSGPFRRWIDESLRANRPMDRFATELILMQGPHEQGGTAGFAVASQNDAPMAMKAHVVMKAFYAVDLECARCHDSPVDVFEQGDLFSLAALLKEGAIKLPATSIIPPVLPGGREPLVSTSLKAGQVIRPAWTLEEFVPTARVDALAAVADRPREQLARILTSPANPRFSDVIANRVWKRYMGYGLVEPVENWSEITDGRAPELLRYLSGRFVQDGYDLKALARLVFTSEAYQRRIIEAPDDTAEPAHRLASPQRRRLSAEQIVDSLYFAVGKDFDAEEQTFDPNRTRGFLNLGTPRRAWQFTSLSNERDRPALSMPVNQSIVDVLTAFGWRETRPNPITARDHSPNPIQPLMLGNGLAPWRAVRLSEESRITELCLQDQTPGELAAALFVTVLSRVPDDAEREAIAALLRPGFDARRTGKPKPPPVKTERAHVDWDKHLDAEATVELLEAERLVRAGDPPTVRLTTDFRRRAEDALWCLFNSPEFVFVP